MPAQGKAGPGFMEKHVYDSLGARSRRTRVPPGAGLDNGVVSVGHGKVLIVTGDPVSAIPEFGAARSAWLSAHLIASDFTTSGVDPEFAVFTYNFPREMDESERGAYVRAMGEACRELGVTIAGGHTGSYPGGGLTVIGSGTMFGLAPERGYVTPAMAAAGDSVLMTKHAGIEAAMSLATAFPELTDSLVGTRAGRRARALVGSCTTVNDARGARAAGLTTRVTSMHDATEGGVLGGLSEMAAASGNSIVVDPDRIPVRSETTEVCKAYGIDPLRSMGEGALLITCRSGEENAVERAVRARGSEAHRVGEVREGSGLWLARGEGRPARFVQHPDRYWSAYAKASERR